MALKYLLYLLQREFVTLISTFLGNQKKKKIGIYLFLIGNCLVSDVFFFFLVFTGILKLFNSPQETWHILMTKALSVLTQKPLASDYSQSVMDHI
jgi:hypothetical protein